MNDPRMTPSVLLQAHPDVGIVDTRRCASWRWGLVVRMRIGSGFRPKRTVVLAVRRRGCFLRWRRRRIRVILERRRSNELHAGPL